MLAEFGPLEVTRQAPPDLDARPHPHAGMAVLAVVLRGAISHRDGLGTVAELLPGDVCLMRAGAGIVHSERMERLRVEGGTAQGLVAWIALPDALELAEPGCALGRLEALPEMRSGAARGRLLIGTAQGVTAFGMTGLHAILWDLSPGDTLALETGHAERAVHVLRGTVLLDGIAATAGTTVVPSERAGPLVAETDATLLEFGGDPVGERLMWWNFLASSAERLEQYKAAWRDGRLPLPPGDTESWAPLVADDERPCVRLRPLSAPSTAVRAHTTPAQSNRRSPQAGSVR
jgi:hypothetical protein